MTDRSLCRGLATYATALAVCLAAMTVTLKLWRADLSRPLFYADAGDTLAALVLVKGQVENGWYVTNDRLGAPGRYDMHDYPVTDVASLALLKLLGLLNPDPFLVYNIFCLLTYPLTTLVTLAVLRRLGVHPLPAASAAVLYAFLPYHQMRLGLGHLFLLPYWHVPLLTLVTVWVARGDAFTRRRVAVALLAVVLAATFNVYYAFFGCFLLVVAGAAGSLRVRSIRPALTGVALAGAIAAGVVAAGLPSLLHKQREGVNAQVAWRGPAQADYFGLKVAHLLLPTVEHRARPLAGLRRDFDDPDRAGDDCTDCASLGLLGAAGFLLLTGCLLARPGGVPEPMGSLGVLNVFVVLLAATGGIGPLFNFLVSGEIRCYNRVVVFVGFFALAALAWAAGRLLFDATRPRWVRTVGWVIVPAATAFGVWDQTTRLDAPRHAREEAAFAADARFIGRIEEALPPGSAVFQLPYFGFPEQPPPGRMGLWNHFRPYLHSRTLRWSFGAMLNREADCWQRRVRNLPPPEMARALALADFRGIYIDREGCAPELEAGLAAVLGTAPLVSENGLRSFYDLGPYADRLRRELGPAGWERERRQALDGVWVLYQDGFFPFESGSESPVHWAGRRATMTLVNPSDRPRMVSLTFSCFTYQTSPVPVRVEGMWGADDVTADERGATREYRLVVPPGRHPVRFRASPPRDFRPMQPGRVFYLTNVAARDLPEGPSADHFLLPPGAGRP